MGTTVGKKAEVAGRGRCERGRGHLSRQRSGVRAPSSPPQIPKDLRDVWRYLVGAERCYPYRKSLDFYVRPGRCRIGVLWRFPHLFWPYPQSSVGKAKQILAACAVDRLHGHALIDGCDKSGKVTGAICHGTNSTASSISQIHPRTISHRFKCKRTELSLS
jgi:hypothetical protein